MSAFTISPPAELKLPTPGRKDTVQYYDRSQPLGQRCAWLVTWLVEKDENTGQQIQPNQWRYNSGAPDNEKMPDEYLLASLEDIICRGREPYSRTAALLYFRYTDLKDAGELENWRWQACDLLGTVSQVPPVIISTYNPPPQKSMHGRVMKR